MHASTDATIADLNLLMHLLDQARNGNNDPLTAESRAALYAVAQEPTQETWEATFGVLIAPHVTLWRAVRAHTSYPVDTRPVGEPWPVVPHKLEVAAALRAVLGSQVAK